MPEAMGVIDVPGAVPRIRHMQAPDETIRDHMCRIAEATAFAYHIDPERCAAQPGFSYTADAILLPNGTVVRGEVSGRVRLERGAALAAAGGGAYLFVYLVRSGRVEMRSSRLSPLGPGDILFHDLAYPAEIVLDGYAVTILIVGRGALPETVRDRELNGAVVRRDHPLAPLIATIIDTLHEQADRLRPDQATAVLTHALALIAMALDNWTTAARAKVPVKGAAEIVIDARLGDTALSPAMIADLLGISRATLYRAFEAYGGVRRAIGGRRLHHAWTLATSDNGPPPKQIAAACGFRSVAQLNRAMHESFGVELRDIRDISTERRASLLAQATVLVKNNWRLVTGQS